MKKYFLFVLLFVSTFAYSQENDTCNYYSLGIFTGTYISRKPVYPVNDYINNINLELEYRKSKDFSFFANVLYLFTGNDLKAMFPYLNDPQYTDFKNPDTERYVVTLGGKYHLSSNKLNTFVQLGISQESILIGDYSFAVIYEYSPKEVQYVDGYWKYYLSAMAGVGINYKFNKNLQFEVQYNCYKNIESDDGNFQGFSVFGGLKYNFF